MLCHQLSKMLEDKKNSPGKNIDIPHRESSEFTREIRLNTRMFISNKIKNFIELDKVANFAEYVLFKTSDTEFIEKCDYTKGEKWDIRNWKEIS